MADQSCVVSNLSEEYSASDFKAIYIEHEGKRFLRHVGNHLWDCTFLVGNKEVHGNLGQNRRCPGQAPPECKSRT